MHPDEKELSVLYKAGKISRREFIRMAALLGLSASSISTFLAACAPKPTPTAAVPTEAPRPTATSAPSPTPVPPTPVPEAGRRGGILKSALGPPKSLDPAFLASASDHQVACQWHNQFIDVTPAGQPDPEISLATNWERNEDATVWDFEVRQGVTFHNGREFTAEDVVFTYNRLRDSEIGAATVAMYSNIKNIEALDDTHVRFTLEKPNPELLLDLADYHAVIMDSEAEDFQTEWNGTGPWIIEEYLPEDRIVFKRNPNYWVMGEDGQPVPYLEGQEWLFLSEPSAQVDALQGGQVHFLLKLNLEYLERLQADPNVEVRTTRSNWHWAIHLRSDKEPFNDNRVRQAIKLATNRSAMLETAALGYGVPGRDTPIGPAYGDYYLDVPEPQRDVEGAKALLAEAGYSEGLEFTATIQDTLGAPAIATVWQEQLAEAGITANIELVPIDVYYGGGVWLECDCGITDWGPRLYPLMYLQLAYNCDSGWNSAHWCDEEVDELTLAIASEPDRDARVQMYHRIQEIMMERGGSIVPYFQDTALAYRTEVKPGIVPPFMPSAIHTEEVWLQS